MTRDDFLQITDMDELYSFICDHNLYDYLDNYYTEDNLDEMLDDQFAEMIRSEGWRTTMNAMNDVPTGWEWYLYDDWGTISGVSEADVEELVHRMYEDLSNEDDLWDDDEEPEPEDGEGEEECVPDEDTEPIDYGDLFDFNNSLLAEIREKNNANVEIDTDDEEELILF